ncbi:hypothetical protein Dimus_015900 [Dionaea muscipula]
MATSSTKSTLKQFIPQIQENVPILDEVPLALDISAQSDIQLTDSERTESEEIVITEVWKGKPLPTRRSNRVADGGKVNMGEKSSENVDYESGHYWTGIGRFSQWHADPSTRGCTRKPAVCGPILQPRF